MKVKSESEDARSCLTLSYPMDYSPPGSFVHGIFQARVLEWGAIGFSMDMYTLLHLKQVTNRDLLYACFLQITLAFNSAYGVIHDHSS